MVSRTPSRIACLERRRISSPSSFRSFNRCSARNSESFASITRQPTTRAPWNQKYRDPGGGDNLFLASIIALKADTGEYVWHYQTSPADTWDYDAVSPMMAVTLTVNGQERRVILQPCKNGFF